MGAANNSHTPQDKQAHPDDCLGASRPWPKRMLLACFFLLGMGLLAFSAAAIQAADYFNEQYKGMQTVRAMNTCYTGAFLAAMIVLFFGGPNLWPDKRARILYGYIALLCALVFPALIDASINQSTVGAPTNSLRACLAPWAVGAAMAGAADATIASVLNGEAAALGCNKAASYGKPAGGMLMAVLRIAVKAMLPAAKGDVDRLRYSVSIHLAVAAAILVACVLAVAFLIPYLVAQVQETESPEVPPGLTFQQTLNTAYTAMEGGPQGEAAAAALQAACSLAPMQPAMDSTFGLPMMEIRRDSGMNLRLSKVQNSLARNSNSVLPATSTLQLHSAQTKFNPSMRQSLVRQYMALHAGAERHNRRSSNCTSPSGLTGTSRCTTPATLSPHSTAARATGEHSRLAHAASMRRQLSSVFGRRTSRRSTAGGKTPPASQRTTPPPASPNSIQASTVHAAVVVTGQHKAHSKATIAEDEDGNDVEKQSQKQQGHQLVCPSVKHARTMERQQTSSVTDAGEGDDVFSDGSLSPSPFHSQQMSTHFDDLDQGAQEISLREALGACWVVMKNVVIFQVAVLIVPLITDHNKAMVWSNAKGTRIEPYYLQVVELAKLLGSMLGSQFLPVYHPHRPKATLLAISAGMLTFFGAFALSMHFKGGPVTMVLLLLCVYTYGGHLNSTAFTLAKENMHPDDSRMAQMLLALSAAAGSWLAYCTSWLWLIIPTA